MFSFREKNPPLSEPWSPGLGQGFSFGDVF